MIVLAVDGAEDDRDQMRFHFEAWRRDDACNAVARFSPLARAGALL
jgi:hypothetical protein